MKISVCDRCGRQHTPNTTNPDEKVETITMKDLDGFNWLEFDICRLCLRRVIKTVDEMLTFSEGVEIKYGD